MIKIKDLQARVEEKEILRGINLEINPGEVHAIMGQQKKRRPRPWQYQQLERYLERWPRCGRHTRCSERKTIGRQSKRRI